MTDTPDVHGSLSPVTREQLYALVWAEPMVKVAARFGVSSSYMARVCSILNVPRPERGHWAKVAVGKTPHQPKLPEPGPGHQLMWRPGGGDVGLPRPLPKAPERRARRRRTRIAWPSGQHGLIRGAKELFEQGRLSYECGYLKPSKRLLVDIAVTSACLDKALQFANALFLAFEERGHGVVLAPSNEPFRRSEVDEREKPSNSNHYNNVNRPGIPGGSIL